MSSSGRPTDLHIREHFTTIPFEEHKYKQDRTKCNHCGHEQAFVVIRMRQRVNLCPRIHSRTASSTSQISHSADPQVPPSAPNISDSAIALGSIVPAPSTAIKKRKLFPMTQASIINWKDSITVGEIDHLNTLLGQATHSNGLPFSLFEN